MGARLSSILYNSMDSSVHGILQARIVEWVAVSFSRDLPIPGIKPTSPDTGRQILYHCVILGGGATFLTVNNFQHHTLIASTQMLVISL